MINDLTSKHCVPCEGGVLPFTAEEIQNYQTHLTTPWEVVDNKKIQKDFICKNFKAAITFVNGVAKIAEKEGHHPDIYLHNYRRVRIELMTHAIHGLSENDFIMAAKIDELFCNTE